MSSEINHGSLDLSGNIHAAGTVLLTVNVITVPKDSIATVLHERLPDSGAGSAAVAWVGLFVTTWAAYFSATFHDALGIKASTIEAVFLIFGIICLAMLIFTCIKYFRNRDRCTIAAIVEDIANKGSNNPS